MPSDSEKRRFSWRGFRKISAKLPILRLALSAESEDIHAQKSVCGDLACRCTVMSLRRRSGIVFSFNSNSEGCIVILQNVSVHGPGIFHVL